MMELRARTKKAAVAVAAAGTLLSPILAGPASAATINGPYYNTVKGGTEGAYYYTDCGGGCAGDGNISVGNVKNGFKVRVRVYANLDKQGWNKYLDRYLPDNKSGKWFTGYPAKGARIGILLCTTNADYVIVGKCTRAYTTNKYY